MVSVDILINAHVIIMLLEVENIKNKVYNNV